MVKGAPTKPTTGTSGTRPSGITQTPSAISTGSPVTVGGGGVVSGELACNVGRVARFLVDEVGLSHVEHGHREESHSALFLLMTLVGVAVLYLQLAAALSADGFAASVVPAARPKSA